MGILEDITGQPDPDKPQAVEVVTLRDEITGGVEPERERSFPTMADALKYANALPKEERDISFIRTSEAVETLDKAELELTERAGDQSLGLPPE
jgi:hypothetical protein